MTESSKSSENFFSNKVVKFVKIRTVRKKTIDRGTPINRSICTTFTTSFEKCFPEDLEILAIHFYANRSEEGGPPPIVRFYDFI